MDAYGNAKNLGSLRMQNLFNDSKPISSMSWATGGSIHLPKTANSSNAANHQLTRDGGIWGPMVGMKHSADGANYYGLDEEKPQKPERRGRKKKRADDVKDKGLGDEKSPKPERRGRKKKRINADEQELPITNGDDSDMRLKNYENAAARKRNVTAEERERAIRAAKAFEPVNPFCRVVLRPSYLYKGCIMYLPSCFAEKHLNEVSGDIKLQYSEKQWPVRCLYKGGRAKFRKGWYEFALENNIGEGDVCVFELLDSSDIVLKVTVFRVIEHGGFMNRPSH